MKALTFLFSIITLSISSLAQWTEPVSGVSSDLNDVHFPTSLVGYAVGEGGSLIKSVDAGDNWTVLSSGSTASLQGVHFTSEDIGFIVGDNTMLTTTDGGTNWQTVSLPVSEILMDIEFTNATTGFCVGAGGTLLKTTDGGANWTIKDSDCDRYLSKIQFPTTNVGYATSKGYNSNFIKTTDGGETWFNDTIDANLIFGSFESVYFMDENTGLIGSWYIYGLVKTTDGGANWVDVSGTESPDLYSIDFANGSVGFAGGINGLVMTTIDAGDNWTSETIGNNVLALQALSSTTVICVGAAGYIAKKENATSSIVPDQPISISIYPNPSTGTFTIQTNSTGNKTYKLYSSDGKLIESLSSTDLSQSINIQQDSGIYLLEVTSEKESEVFRVVVE